MSLAVALGKTLRELREEITADEIPLWAAYASVHGLPSDRLEVVMAKGFCAMANSWGGKCQPKDFLPVVEKVKVISSEEGFKMFVAMAENHNRRING